MPDPGSNRVGETGTFFQRDRLWHPPALTPDYKTSVLRSPQKAPLAFDNTLSELTGPVFGHAILGELDNDLIHNFARPGESAIGERIIVYGRVLDERGRASAACWSNSGRPIRAAATATRRMAIWRRSIQILAAAAAPSPTTMAVMRFARLSRDPIPGPTGPMTGGLAHPFLDLRSRLRATADHANVFRGRPLIWRCPIVRGIRDKAAIETLIAAADMQATIPMDARAYKFDIVLRGRRSSLFENRLEGN